MTIWVPNLPEGNSPIYKKLADAIDLAIAEGELKPEQKLPPQRRLADALAVTVGTVTRAYSEAERRGSVAARVGSGTYVKGNNPPHYLSHDLVNKHSSDSSACYDLRSSKAPLGLQLPLLAEALQDMAMEQSLLNECLLYQPEIGLLHQRQQLAHWLCNRNFECDEQHVLFTYGGQHGISLSLQTLCRAGDTVLCEGLSFPGISVACQQQQLRCIGLEMDEFGVTPESLISACAQGNPRVLYLTAQMQNPTCVQMPVNRKQQLLSICEEFDITILEDDVQFLPQSEKLTSFYELNPKRTVYISSFSKSFSGGIRIGYVIANSELREALRVSVRASCWTVPPLMVEIVCRWLTSGKMNQMENWLKQEMGERSAILKDVMGDTELTFHSYGFNAWLALPEAWRAVDFVAHAEQRGVLIRAAESYAVGRFSAPQNVRLCICAPDNQTQLRKALEILKLCLQDVPTAVEFVI